ncbi:MAG: hypothetical protein M0P26_07325, partial [Bacteroidales bacterium]|nr:hypothetical protein [Bacteroidales bacterium]
FLLTLHAGIAQVESENKSENIKWGLKRSTMDSDSPAFSRRCYGYDCNEEKGLILNIAEASIVLKIFGWYGMAGVSSCRVLGRNNHR